MKNIKDGISNLFEDEEEDEDDDEEMTCETCGFISKTTEDDEYIRSEGMCRHCKREYEDDIRKDIN